MSSRLRRLVVPAVLAVTVLGGPPIISSGCDSKTPEPVDGALAIRHDGGVDAPDAPPDAPPDATIDGVVDAKLADGGIDGPGPIDAPPDSMG